MAKVIIEGLTMVQAKVLANWYEGQGEQDCIPWFEEYGEGESSPFVKTISVNEDIEEVIINC